MRKKAIKGLMSDRQYLMVELMKIGTHLQVKLSEKVLWGEGLQEAPKDKQQTKQQTTNSGFWLKMGKDTELGVFQLKIWYLCYSFES